MLQMFSGSVTRRSGFLSGFAAPFSNGQRQHFRAEEYFFKRHKLLDGMGHRDITGAVEYGGDVAVIGEEPLVGPVGRSVDPGRFVE